MQRPSRPRRADRVHRSRGAAPPHRRPHGRGDPPGGRPRPVHPRARKSPSSERQLAEFCGAKHVLSCANGTDALGLALMAKGAGPGHAVLVPSFTFAATAEVVAWFGATPVFVDVLRRHVQHGPGEPRGRHRHGDAGSGLNRPA